MPVLNRLTICLAALLGCLVASSARAETLSLGTLNEGIRAQMREYEPFVEFLESTLQEVGISQVKVVMHPTAEAMAAAMARHEVDIFIDSPLVAAKVAKLSGATPFLRRWKGGLSSYHSVIIARTDSDINSVEDLSGRIVAFEEPDSTSGFLLPAHMITQAGLMLRETRSTKPITRSGEVGYFFTFKDKNTLFALANNSADAGATNLDAFMQLEAARPGEFRVIASSVPVPRNVLMHRDDMNPELLAYLKTVLTTMFRSEEGRKVLKEFQNTAGFDEFPEGSKAAFAPIFQILQDLEDVGIK